MKRPATVTMTDLARHLGLSTATVSRALRHHPAIPDDTCEDVRRAAEELGYRPNPMIGALMSQLRQRRPRSLVNLACLYAEEASGNLVRAEQAIVTGFLAEAARLGYHAEAERWSPNAGAEAALVRRWRARNARGVFLLNVRADHDLALPWAEFCWVIAGNMVGAPALHRVGNEIHQLVKLALEQMLRLGCHRPALAVPLVGESRQGFRWAGAFCGNWFALMPGAAEPLIYRDTWEETAFRRWLRAVKPDAVLALTDDVFAWLEAAGQLRGPKPRFIHLAANTSRLAVPGVCQDFAAVGAAAAQMLDGQLRRNERGIPAEPTTLTVAGTWREGSLQPTP
ncbi:MAG: LacI family DNA-binding transcriptional regulator [Verrucomicrobia bacterium]|nr:LacI family DNA-binding transcriptional regulator [Verrucomicrobiota bacterium]